jgi:hypothetical protein
MSSSLSFVMTLRSLLAKNFIGRTLAILKDLVEAVTGEATKSKTIVYKSVQESLHTTLALFPVYIHEPGRNLSSALKKM